MVANRATNWISDSSRGVGSLWIYNASMHHLLPLLFCCLFAVFFIADAANLKVIFDGQLNLRANATLTPLERKTFNDVVYWQAQRAWQDKDGCGDDLMLLDAATGSFLRPRAVQKALLYRFCSTGHNMGYAGIAIFERGTLVRHEVFAGGAEFAIGKMPDLNLDGVDELLIANGGTNMGQTWTNAIIYQMGSKPTQFVASFDAYYDYCGTLEQVKPVQAWKTYVEMGKQPRLYQQEFRGLCESNKPFAQSGRLKSLPLQKPEAVGWKRLR